MFTSSPTPARHTTSELPPEERNGSGVPLVGTMLRVTETLTRT